jgi:hypothetical protein
MHFDKKIFNFCEVIIQAQCMIFFEKFDKKQQKKEGKIALF